MEDAHRKIQDAVNGLVNDLDKGALRRTQYDMHQCAAKCCLDDKASTEQIHSCIDRCSVPLQKGQQYVQQELTQFQDRLQRCVMSCQDNLKDKIGPKTTEAEALKYRDQFESCARKCVETHIALLPALRTKMMDVLGSSEYKK
ncbi:protein FAM136A-like [Artemia franciscana]|uniref:Protein FAM136A n=1 Tax=Artemia franciscana TaxID=6661 RepID=A0AA88KUA9_ARTSF|nr:hypothetical protein QYM36_018063 [Artemia franciscana]